MIGAIVLAAGASRRYGRASKLLAPMGRLAVIEYSLRALDGQPLRPVVIVTGRERQRLRRRVARHGHDRSRLRWVHNPDHRNAGMADSLRRGLSALPRTCDAALIMLGDMPNVEARTIARLCRSWRPGLDYVRPTHAGRPGHPVIVSRSLFDQLAALTGDRGAKPILDRIPRTRCRWIEAPAGCLTDVDTPAALRRAVRRINRDHSENETDTVSSSVTV